MHTQTIPTPMPPRADTPDPTPSPGTVTRVYDGDADRMIGSEWVLANGLGGFAMGTALGTPARRYHSILTAATSPPVGRVNILSHLVDELILFPGSPNEERIDLSSFRFAGVGGGSRALHPDGHRHLRSFEVDHSARWRFEVNGHTDHFEILRELCLVPGTNAAVVRYVVRCFGDRVPAKVVVRPLTALKDFHAVTRQDQIAREMRLEIVSDTQAVVHRSGHSAHLVGCGLGFIEEQDWWRGFWYERDAERCQEDTEDLYCPGRFEGSLVLGPMWQQVAVQVSDRQLPAHDVDQVVSSRKDRTGRLVSSALTASHGSRRTDPACTAALAAASDAFVVKRQNPDAPPSTTVIAGYPWFADWGRDSMICLPGLLLCTGRFDRARELLETFARRRRNGLIPNTFDDRTGEPMYNTVDASLWYIQNACTYIASTGDYAGTRERIIPACMDVVDAYRRGTEHNIAMDPNDKLISAGSNATQLTWMDAKRDGTVFTPRHGKAVEINALWRSGLMALAEIMRPLDPRVAADLSDLAHAVGQSFVRVFWNERRGCLHDCITPDGTGAWRPQSEVRPNQVFAVSLPYSPLSHDQQQSVLRVVERELWTPMGLRTLEPSDRRYRGRYEGNMYDRDASYHNGTAWPWLLGPYAEAVLRVGRFTEDARRKAWDSIRDAASSFDLRAPGAAMGQVAEVFDADTAHPGQHPGGCPAQAWSVAELLRAICLIERV